MLYLTTTTHSYTILSMTTTNKQRLTIFLNPAIIKQAKAQALIEEITLTSYVEKALSTCLPKETVIKKPEII